MYSNCDVTIYNKIVINRETKYIKSHIYKVFWEDTKGVNSLTMGLNNADSSKIFIPFSSCKEYVKPKEFKRNKAGMTLQTEDIIVKGIIEEEINSIKDLANYDDVRVITTVDTADYGSEDMRHWKVGAK